MSDERLIIYHNPQCSKSRETLEILQHHGCSPEIVEYLQRPPSAEELKQIIKLLGLSARDLLRTTEAVYDDAGLDDEALGDDEIIAALREFPVLLQRPIVVAGNKAIIGRPPSRVIELIA